MEKIEVKEKRSLQSSKNFATAQQMDQVQFWFNLINEHLPLFLYMRRNTSCVNAMVNFSEVFWPSLKVMKVFAELRDLPKNVSSMMSAAKQEMTRSLSQVHFHR